MRISDIKYYIFRTAAAVMCTAVWIHVPAKAEEPLQTGSAVLAQEDIVHVHRGNKDTAGGCYTAPVYHVHQGNETDGGACFSPVYHVHTKACGIETRTCSARLTGYRYTGSRMCSCHTHGDFRQHQASVTRYHDCCGTETVSDEWCGCQYCGLQEPAQTNPHTYTVTHCGRDSTSIDGYRLSCDKAADTVDHYDIGCGLEEGRTYGAVKVVNNTPGWQVDGTSVSVVIEDPENVLNGKVSEDCSYKGSDGTVFGSSGRDIRITENGTYYAAVKAETSPAGPGGYVLGFKVMNIDRTAPVIRNITMDESAYCRMNSVTVEAGDVQPDGSAGSGSEEMQYSFDGGDTWQQGASSDITKNGIYDVKVKDLCGNISSEQIAIDNIDREAPEYRLDMPGTWHCGDGGITVKITASDKGSGLADKPYSFDGGKTWTDVAEYTADSPAEIDIRVRDIIGNEGGEKIELKYTPEDKKGGSGENAPAGGAEQTGAADAEKKEDASEANPVTGNGADPGTEGLRNSRMRQNGKNSGTGRETDWAAVPAGESGGRVKEKGTVYAGNGRASVRLSGNDGAKVRTDEKKDGTPFYRTMRFRTAAASTGAVLGIALLFLAGWILYRGIRIYNYDGRRYRYMGLALVMNGVRGYEMSVEEHIREEAYTERYILRPFLPFLKRHANENMLIKAGSARFTAILEKSIAIDMHDR